MLLFLIPISIVPYLPSFFFGSLLMLFGVEISLSWLVLSYKKVCVPEEVFCYTMRDHFALDSALYSLAEAWPERGRD